MSDIDEISHIIGKLEGQLKGIEKKQDEHGRELLYIRNSITNNRMKLAGLSTIVSGGVSALYYLIHGK